jgi:hypothetical protein
MTRKRTLPSMATFPGRFRAASPGAFLAPFPSPFLVVLGLALPGIGVGAIPMAAQQGPLTDAWQIRFAVETLPAEFQEGASVFRREGEEGLELHPLKPGGGAFICLLTLDLEEERAHSACYHDSLEPFMARGRELRREGMGDRVQEIRNREIEEGRLGMPSVPASMYQRTASSGGWNPATGEVTSAPSLFVIYVPFATAESTGLSTRPTRGSPWLMDPGTPRAHIMFQPDMTPGGG